MEPAGGGGTFPRGGAPDTVPEGKRGSGLGSGKVSTAPQGQAVGRAGVEMQAGILGRAVPPKTWAAVQRPGGEARRGLLPAGALRGRRWPPLLLRGWVLPSSL